MAKTIDDYDIDPEALRLKNLLDRLVEDGVGVFDSYGVPLPALRHWVPGQAAFDCEQFVVTLVQGYLGAPGDQANTPQKCDGPRSMVATISTVRCVPIGVNGKPPTDAALKASSDFQAVDAWVLLQSLNTFGTWSDGFQGPGVIGTVNILPPSGSFIEVQLQLTVAVE